MALKAIHMAGVPNFDHTNLISENATLDFSSTLISQGTMEKDIKGKMFPKFVVIGHRGSGMNILQSSDPRMKDFKENSIVSFNYAAQFNLGLIEFDVQVTKDDRPVIFHDIHILTKDEKGLLLEKRVTDITLEEFLSYGPQKEPNKVGKPMFRRTKDGCIYEWKVEKDSPLCTLQEVFEKVDKSVGFNIELKFDDNKKYDEAELKHIIQAVVKIVDQYAVQKRLIFFSSFQPDAVQIIRKLQDDYPVFFLTNGGCEIYADSRRNTLEEAINLCLEAGLQGIVSQVRAIFRHPAMISKIKDSNLSLITYGQLNNVPEAVYMQHLMGVEGVIVDFVQEIKEAVSDFTETCHNETREEKSSIHGKEMEENKCKRVPKFSDRELSFLLKLIPELVQN